MTAIDDTATACRAKPDDYNSERSDPQRFAEWRNTSLRAQANYITSGSVITRRKAHITCPQGTVPTAGPSIFCRQAKYIICAAYIMRASVYHIPSGIYHLPEGQTKKRVASLRKMTHTKALIIIRSEATRNVSPSGGTFHRSSDFTRRRRISP
jgi:hypothetical protein